jgi:drug/metabolite transporter (DMT)-like permease
MTGNKWLLPALGFVVLTGLLGVTIKLALRGANWPELLTWAGIVYALLALASIPLGNTHLHFGVTAVWGVTSAFCAALGLICSFIALRHASAVVAVPVMSAYPVVTVVASVAILHESLSLTKLLGMGLVLAGVVLLAR